MKHGRSLGIVVAVVILAVWPARGRADDEEGGGGGGEAAEPSGGDHAAAPDPGEEHAGSGEAAADPGEEHAGSGEAADADHDGTPDSAEDRDHDGTPDSAEDRDHDGTPDSAEAAAGDSADADDDADEPPYVEYDTDGDGVVEPAEAAFEKEYEQEFAAIPDEVTDAALDSRPNDVELKPSLTVEQFRKLVRLAKAKVLPRLEAKMERKQAKKMLKFTYGVAVFALCGVLLLLTPLGLRKKYPGKGKLLFRYAALAAATWVITVGLFGGVLYGMRTVQGAMSGLTNPQLAIAGGLFDTLDRNAERYIVMGKELFAPTLEQLQGNADEQPAATVIANGTKIIKDARVFLSMAKLFKKLDWLFGMLPIILLGVTLLLFLLAIKPTLIEIIKLPTRAAEGEANAGRDVAARSMRRVAGELKATLATIGVLTLLTILSAFVLGQIVGPALDGLLSYFSLAVTYLQFKDGASSGLVFCTLFGVIFFLVLNLATLILSTAFFLGKTQKIFQARFNDDVPLSRHQRFFKWGVPAVVFVQLFPLLFVFVAQLALEAINNKLLGSATSADGINWTAMLLAGPLFLVFAYIVVFWAARGIKAIRFLFAYKVKDPKKVAELPKAVSLPR